MTSAPGRLFVVATPLGHLDDITLRGLRVLREAQLIACEDTRRTSHLLRAHRITTPTTSYFEHNARFKGKQILAALHEGKDVALVADAGTPGISDPGFRLVRDARAAGIAVLPVPGPSAVVAALSVSGLPTDRFLFVGFLPSKAAARRETLRDLARIEQTLVFYESPLRVLATLADMIENFGDREAFLCREATKLHEEYLRAPLSGLRQALESRQAIKGEIVLVVDGAAALNRALEPTEPPETLVARLRTLGHTRRQAVKQAARALGLPAREVYRRVLAAEGKAKTE